MATKKIVSREKPDTWMTQELSQHEDCGGSSLKVRHLLQAPDDNGCNWSGDCSLSDVPRTRLVLRS